MSDPTPDNMPMHGNTTPVRPSLVCFRSLGSRRCGFSIHARTHFAANLFTFNVSVRVCLRSRVCVDIYCAYHLAAVMRFYAASAGGGA